MDSPIDYKFIKKWIARGEISSIAKEHNISKGVAYRILSGKGYLSNTSFVKACYDAALQNAHIYLAYLEKTKNVTEALKRIDPENKESY